MKGVRPGVDRAIPGSRVLPGAGGAAYQNAIRSVIDP
jgi:hypothetical protein